MMLLLVMNLGFGWGGGIAPSGFIFNRVRGYIEMETKVRSGMETSTKVRSGMEPSVIVKASIEYA